MVLAAKAGRGQERFLSSSRGISDHRKACHEHRILQRLSLGGRSIEQCNRSRVPARARVVRGPAEAPRYGPHLVWAQDDLSQFVPTTDEEDGIRQDTQDAAPLTRDVCPAIATRMELSGGTV